MEASALPYLLYFVYKIITFLAFGLIGHIQRRALMLWVCAWVLVGAARYAIVVLSAGATPMIDRDSVVWTIRYLVYVEEHLYLAAAIAFAAENVTWKKKNGNPNGNS